jgi:transcriptional regulator with XRE-family HTH domain
MAKQRTPQSVNNANAVAAMCALKLLELRDHTKETQMQLGRRLHMTESMISRLESGNHVPSLRTLCRIADAFGKTLEIKFHEHEHKHADGTKHTHPHHHIDADHKHSHKSKK